MNTATQNPMAGYIVMKNAAEQMAERGQQHTLFEVIDIKTGTRTNVETSIPVKKTKKRGTKLSTISPILVGYEEGQEPPANDPSQDLGDDTMSQIDDGQGPAVKENKVGTAIEDIDTPEIEVVFITPYTEVTVNCFEVFRDKTVFTVLTPKNDRVKVKPQRGAKLSAVHDNQIFELYASGIYIPIKKDNSTLSIFFIIDETQEQE
jgi:hypothetical protein